MREADKKVKNDSPPHTSRKRSTRRSPGLDDGKTVAGKRRIAYAIGGGVVTDGRELFLADGTILVRDGAIVAVGHTRDIIGKTRRSSRADGIGDEPISEFIDVHGRIIMPGLLNPHHHLYSSLATGLGPVGSADSFTQQLENLWWRLDRAHDRESVYYSAMTGIVDSVKHGVTTIFDHHASMEWVEGSLETVARAFDTVGIKGVLCYETSDRMGAAHIDTQIEENLSFWTDHQQSETLHGSFGLHANFTLSEKSLKLIAARKEEAMPVHIHCGEDRADLEYCRQLGYEGPVHRLSEHELLDGHSILAHAVHLSETDYQILREIHPIVVSNPESNANNQVGRMDRRKIAEYVLGTDGMSGDLLQTTRFHFLLGQGRKQSLKDLGEVFFSSKLQAQQKYFPDTGDLSPGARADIAVLDYVPITPVSPENLMGHLLFGAKGGRVFMTVSDGVIIFRDGKITTVDETNLIREARTASEKLHRRYHG